MSSTTTGPTGGPGQQNADAIQGLEELITRLEERLELSPMPEADMAITDMQRALMSDEQRRVYELNLRLNRIDQTAGNNPDSTTVADPEAVIGADDTSLSQLINRLLERANTVESELPEREQPGRGTIETPDRTGDTETPTNPRKVVDDLLRPEIEISGKRVERNPFGEESTFYEVTDRNGNKGYVDTSMMLMSAPPKYRIIWENGQESPAGLYINANTFESMVAKYENGTGRDTVPDKEGKDKKKKDDGVDGPDGTRTPSDRDAARVAGEIRENPELAASLAMYEKATDDMEKFKKELYEKGKTKDGKVNLSELSEDEIAKYERLQKKQELAREMLKMEVEDKMPEVKGAYIDAAINNIRKERADQTNDIAITVNDDRQIDDATDIGRILRDKDNKGKNRPEDAVQRISGVVTLEGRAQEFLEAAKSGKLPAVEELSATAGVRTLNTNDIQLAAVLNTKGGNIRGV